MSNRKPREAFNLPRERSADSFLGDDTPEKLWRAARVIASLGSGPYKAAIDALTPVETNLVPTMSVDDYYRVYFNPNWVERIVQEAKDISEDNPCPLCGATEHHRYSFLAGVIWHEAQHPLRKHSQRYEEKGFSSPLKWNIANDCEINDDGIELFKAIQADNKKEGIISPLICFPAGGEMPSLYNLPDHLSAEEYYMLLPDNVPGPNCGSGSHGVPCEWELGAPTPENPGVTEGDADIIEKKVAADIRACNGRGVGGLGAMLDWANQKLPEAKYDYRAELTKILSLMANKIPGASRRNIRKFHRKSAAIGFRVIIPASYSSSPNILVVLDTSGSMMGDRISQALAEVDQIMKNIRARVLFSCADYDAGVLQEVRSLTEIELTGGGGTSMRRGVRTALANAIDDKKTKPDIVVLVTDLETDYPLQEEMQGVPLLIVGINRSSRANFGDSVPDWANFVHIPID